MAYNYNHVTLVGRLARDPEYKKISEDRGKTMFTLAINRNYKREEGKDSADFVPISIWGRLAELAADFLKKGAPVLVWGKIRVRSYEKDSETKWITEVVADNFQLLERKSECSWYKL